MGQFCPFASRTTLSSMLLLVARNELKQSPLGRLPRARHFTSMSNVLLEHFEDSCSSRGVTTSSSRPSASEGSASGLWDELVIPRGSTKTPKNDAQSSSTKKQPPLDTETRRHEAGKRVKNPSNRVAGATASNLSKKKSFSPLTSISTDTPLTSKPEPNPNRPPNGKPPKRQHWQIQKDALKTKFAEGWNPAKKLSPDAMDGIRQLHATGPEQFTTPVLAEHFKVSPEAIRRILKSKWRPSEDEMVDRRQRWQKRHDRIWSQMAELGLRPKRKRMSEVADVNILYEGEGKEVR